MACPSSGTISLYGIARELELDNYDNTIPISTYLQYYNTPISLGNMSQGGGGFEDIIDWSPSKPDQSSPHSMSEFHGYDHDAPEP